MLYAFDAFVSYRRKEPDLAWVRDILLPHLKEADVRVCVDFENFRLGVPLVSEIERAITVSRYTVPILTPAYLGSAFTDFETILADHLGLEEAESRLIAIVREPCALRLGLRARLWLDMSDDAKFDSSFTKLVAALLG